MLNPLRQIKFRTATPPLLGGRYQVIQQLSRGGFGQTFLAQDQHLPGHPVCVIKQLKPQMSDASSLQTARRLFDTEAEVLYALGEHDQIPRLMAHFEEQQEFYLAQEYVEGESLSQLLERDETWSQGRAIALLEDILSVLDFVHRQDVIHRDIKPSNLICRRRDGRIVLIDFGAVKQVNTEFLNPQTGQTNLTISIGTQGYVPNEQIAGMPHFSSDVYAVGIIGIQVLSGTKPKHLKQDVRTSELEWREVCREIDPALAAIIDRLVHYDHRERYATAAEALAALKELPPALRQTIPDSWYALPPAAIPVVPTQETTVSMQPATRPTLAVARRAPTVSQTISLKSTNSPPTLAVLGRYVSEQLFWGTKPKGETVPVLTIQATERSTSHQHFWRLYVALVCGAVLVIMGLRIKPFSSASDSVPPLSSPVAALTPTEQLTEAEALRSQGQFPLALERYDQVIAQSPGSEAAHWGRCYSLNQLQQFQAAIAACEQALSLNPNNAQAVSSKGFALQQQQRFDEALALFDQAIALQPENAEFHNNRGVALLQLDRSQDALAAFDAAIERQPEFAEAWNNRGATLWSLRRIEEATAALDRALAIKPNYPDALSLRQQMQAQLKR